MSTQTSKTKEKNTPLNPKVRKRFTIFLVTFGLLPLFLIFALLFFQPEDSMPSVAMLDNPPELLASVVYSDDAKTELGRFWKINRTSVKYNEISPYVIEALISTEDERFMEHSGVDFKAVGRAVVNAGSAGGASTITQQLAKLLFTLQKRDRNSGVTSTLSESSYRMLRLLGRVNEKAKENIIASRLEKRYTKEEIITMYLNQFDFLYNAVGIENASKVYFDKAPIDLTKDEAAMLVGMCKNPGLFNPHSFQVKNYRRSIALDKKIEMSAVSESEILERRSADSLRAAQRRNQVLYQWLKNSDKKNPAIKHPLTRAEYDELKMRPIVTKYQKVDHKEGVAPYFRESIRSELTRLFAETKADGSLKYARPDGEAWNIYNDGLKIYTTINVSMQKYAEAAVEKHIKNYLQPAFDKNNKGLKNFPFSNSISSETVENIMRSARRNSARFHAGKELGKTDEELTKEFNEPAQMSVFSWKGDIDTVLTPNDSIRYYKSFLHCGMMSVEPQTGFVKAWVGGTNIDHFAYDHVRQGARQVGSTIKPFVYATALSMGTAKPCTEFNGNFCVGDWCPDGKAAGSMANGLAQSSNPTTVAVMSSMGPVAGTINVAKFLKDVDINLAQRDITPPMCLGTMDLSLYQLIPAQAMFVNQGIFITPSTIFRIEDRNGNVIYNAKPVSREVLNENVAYTMIKMLEGVINFGTGNRLRRAVDYGNIRVPMAGKTGTTQSNSDGWFVGFTPELVTGVWVGAEDRSVRFRSTAIGQGASVALPIYGYYMNNVYKDATIGLSTTDFERPPNYDPQQFACDGALYGTSSSDNLEDNPFF
ncbi:MAG: transglycosylase domain-containing protein [Bacteroidota bacterium]